MNNKKPLSAAGILLGIGLGGFFDGILFHQILQTHSMLSNIYFPNTVLNIEINMFWDGMFHAFTWLTTILGIWFLWHAGVRNSERNSGLYFIGLLFVGWGLFNTIEGTINHLVLQLHHVIQRTTARGQFVSDICFLISGLLLIAVGVLMMYKFNENSRNKFVN